MQIANAKKNIINIKNTIQLPFDGTAKCGKEVAKMVCDALLKGNEEKVEIIFPAQWSMSPAHMLHPDCGVLALLDKENAAYKFTGFARNGAIGVTATRCC